MPDGRADALAAWPAPCERVGQGPEAGRHLVEDLRVRGDEGGVPDEQRQVGLDGLVPRVEVAEHPAKAALGIVDLGQRPEVGQRMLRLPVLGARPEERSVVGEVRVDGVPLDACPLGDPADRRPRRAGARVQVDRGLDDPLSRLRLPPRPLFQLVLPIHCT